MAPSYAIKRPGLLFCWLCGATPNMPPKDWHGPFGLEIAHIASGGGRAVRKDDARAVTLLCSCCHKVHVSDSDRLPSMHICGEELPTIDERHTLWLKREMDFKYYDRQYLSEIFIGRVPEEARPPEYYCRLFYKRTGMVR